MSKSVQVAVADARATRLRNPQGFARATIFERLGGVLSGADKYRDDRPGDSGFRDTGLFHFAIAEYTFVAADQEQARASQLCEAIHAVPPADGFDAALAPDDPEFWNRRDAAEHLTLRRSVWNDIQTPRPSTNSIGAEK